MWRKAIIDAIRTDPEWKNGEYTSQPRGLRFAAQLLFLMGSSPLVRQKAAPTLKKADELFEKGVSDSLARLDANDVLYAVESSFDYDPYCGAWNAFPRPAPGDFNPPPTT